MLLARLTKSFNFCFVHEWSAGKLKLLLNLLRVVKPSLLLYFNTVPDNFPLSMWHLCTCLKGLLRKIQIYHISTCRQLLKRLKSLNYSCISDVK